MARRGTAHSALKEEPDHIQLLLVHHEENFAV
jgi:hypothetical protein